MKIEKNSVKAIEYFIKFSYFCSFRALTLLKYSDEKSKITQKWPRSPTLGSNIRFMTADAKYSLFSVVKVLPKSNVVLKRVSKIY